MAQTKVITWTNPNPAIARNLDVGFEVDMVTIVDTTNGGSWQWNSGMANGTVLDVDAGTIAGSNGVTPVSQGAMFGAAISNFTSANPGVITASNLAAFGFEAGDTVMVSAVAESGSGNSKNGTFTVASVSATALTLSDNTTGYNTYVSGGYVSRVSDADGNPIPTNNVAIQGITLGTSAVGGNAAAMVAVVQGAMNVT